jgi:hypothetical protein
MSALDDLIDKFQTPDYQELYDHYGGCCCALGHPPCGFCENYDWDEDPLNIN